MLTVAIPKRNKLQNIIVLTPKDGIVEYGTHEELMNLKGDYYKMFISQR